MEMKKQNLFAILFLSMGMFLTTACSDDESDKEDGGDNKITAEMLDKVIVTYVDKTVIPTYALMDEKVEALDNAVKTFISSGNQNDLDAACDAWRAARKPWEESEAFLYGPADYENLDPSLDSWPLQKDDIDQILATQDFSSLDDDTEDAQGVRGYHTLEYLLFNDGKPKVATTVTSNEKGYMQRVSARLLKDAQRLHKAWLEGLGTTEVPTAFGQEMKDHNGRLSSAAHVVSTIIDDGIKNIADEVGSQKIANPYNYWKSGEKEQAVLEVESWYSWNSLVDYEDNIISIENSYLGGREGSRDEATSMSALVKSVDESLDSRVKEQLTATRKAIRNIPAPFRSNLGATTEIEAAMKACSELSNIFTEVANALEVNN